MTVTIPNRPFATERITGLMLPDGIFEATLGNQQLNAQFRNELATPVDMNVYVESVSDPRFIIAPETYTIQGAQGGVSRLFSWDVDINTVPPGTYYISFIAETRTGQTRIIKKVFVTRIQFDPTTMTFSAQTPEGTLETRFRDLVQPKNNLCCFDMKSSPEDVQERGTFLNWRENRLRGMILHLNFVFLDIFFIALKLFLDQLQPILDSTVIYLFKILGGR